MQPAITASGANGRCLDDDRAARTAPGRTDSERPPRQHPRTQAQRAPAPPQHLPAPRLPARDRQPRAGPPPHRALARDEPPGRRAPQPQGRGRVRRRRQRPQARAARHRPRPRRPGPPPRPAPGAHAPEVRAAHADDLTDLALLRLDLVAAIGVRRRRAARRAALRAPAARRTARATSGAPRRCPRCTATSPTSLATAAGARGRVRPRARRPRGRRRASARSWWRCASTGDRAAAEASLRELHELARTAGVEVVDAVLQVRARPTRAT